MTRTQKGGYSFHGVVLFYLIVTGMATLAADIIAGNISVS
jgi:hypothetical protein